MLNEYGVEGKMLNVITVYDGRTACVRVNGMPSRYLNCQEYNKCFW